jgi:hypothetical protein
MQFENIAKCWTPVWQQQLAPAAGTAAAPCILATAVSLASHNAQTEIEACKFPYTCKVQHQHHAGLLTQIYWIAY